MKPRKPKQKLEPLPTQQRLAAIDVFTESVVLSVFSTSGGVQRRLIDPAALTELIETTGRGPVFKLPQPAGSVVAVAPEAGGALRLWLVRRAGSRTARSSVTIRLEVGRKTKTLRVRPGNLLAEVLWKDGLQSIQRVLRFEGTRLRPDTVLRTPALPNVHGDGRLCMGSVKAGAAAAGMTDPLAAFERAFFGTLFTDHLTGSVLSDASPFKSVLTALVKCKGRVPAHHLRKVTTYGEI